MHTHAAHVALECLAYLGGFMVLSSFVAFAFACIAYRNSSRYDDNGIWLGDDRNG